VEAVKKKVSFSRCNLADDSRMVFMKGMDVIFCCNVLIYFEGTSKGRVISHFYNNLNPGGYLYLGYSESLFGFNDAFHLVHFPGTTAYRKPEPGPRAGAR
jgi:chemotaxis protein methyltransferase CheR